MKYDELSKAEKQEIQIESNAMKKFYTLPLEKRSIALDNIVMINEEKPISNLKG